MKKYLFGTLAVASMALVGCSQEEQLTCMNDSNETFTGLMEVSESRTSLGEDGSTIWSDEDAVSIFKKNGYHQKYQVTEGGNATATFKYAGESQKHGATLDLNYAVYPYYSGHRIDNNGTFTLDLSSLATQNYTEGTFENGKSVMTAKSENNDLVFYNTLSMLRVKLCSEVPGDYRITSITLTSDTYALSGTATVDMSQDKQPAVFDNDNGGKTITLTCKPSVVLENECDDETGGHDFYILVPAVTFPAGDLTIKVEGEDNNGNEITYEAEYPEELILKRSGITTIHHEFEEDDWTGTIEPDAIVSTDTELTAAVANGATNIYLNDGEYYVTGCGGKTLTLSGSKNAVLKLKNEGEDGCDYSFGSAGTGIGDITFNGLTINTTENTGNYKGYAYMKGTFNNCNFVGAYSLNNANDFVFNNCTFDFKNGYFWTWGANSVTFDGCTFNGNSKNILAHGWASTTINIVDCKFAATEVGTTGSGDPTAAVEIDPAGTNIYTINFTGNNTKTDNYAGWYRIKDGSTGHTISIDDAIVSPIVGNVGRESYEGDLFDTEFDDGLFVQDEKLEGAAAVTLNRIYETVALENVVANVDGNLITASADNTIVLYNCEITLDEGEMMIVTTEGVTVGQVMIHNVTVNGELLTQETAGKYMQGVNWYEVW